MTVGMLAPEWERLDLLGACTAFARRGEVPDAPMRERLEFLEGAVHELRDAPPWRDLSLRHGLDPLDREILACAVAPEAEPRLGWMYQELQAGALSPYPTTALIRELLCLDQAEAIALRARLHPGAPLLRGRLLEPQDGSSFAPLRPTPRAAAALLGSGEAPAEAPVGALAMPALGGWDELVLPATCLCALREFLLWVECRDQVFGQWGAREVGGPVALFAGPSGTGKTFAAEVVANALGWPLYRVDLGLLVSKYVGETEKNLNALFDSAHGRDMVLLFDEADSLFGRRGEVKEARDRYANMEVSHLLARMERHRGPCILTSNLRQHLDPAFARRFQAVIEFPRPDAAARAQLWRRHLPPGAPLASEVDPEMLGAAVPLTGGQIRNAALHAAFLAAGEGERLDLSRIARAVWMELAKEGTELLRSGLGPLASHLQETAG
jgi:hypothetical protein